MADQTKWEKREEFEDGTYNEICVRKVENGFIKKVTKHYKENGEWEYETKESIHEENPLEEKTLVDKLEEFMKNS